MTVRRHLARFMTAVVVMIAALVAASAVSAHEGHAHAAARPAPSAGKMPHAAHGTAASPDAAAAGSHHAMDSEPDCRRGACGGPACGKACCGVMSCSASGMPADAAFRAPANRAYVALRAHDVLGRSGPDPEALPEPPRTIA